MEITYNGESHWVIDHRDVDNAGAELLIVTNPNHTIGGTWVNALECDELPVPHPSQTLSCFI